MSAKPLTGRTVFLITAGAFSVIIGVNVALAINAVRTFPGLEVRNSYVASQSFDHDRAAQEALGWTARAGVADGVLTLAFTDDAGAPVRPAEVTALVGRPTSAAEDFEPAFAYRAGRFLADADLASGAWSIRIAATAEDGTVFRQRLPLYVRAAR